MLTLFRAILATACGVTIGLTVLFPLHTGRIWAATIGAIVAGAAFLAADTMDWGKRR